jgi:hypothetical protein
MYVYQELCVPHLQCNRYRNTELGYPTCRYCDTECGPVARYSG